MERPVVGPRYMSRFACLGSACEDTCCSGWTITIDNAHYESLRELFSHSESERKIFEASVSVRSDGGRRVALMVLNAQTGRCNFLTDDQLCSVHAKHGHVAIADACATYPRKQSRVGDRVEVTAHLSCPEAVRQALLLPDALDIVDLRPESVEREDWTQRCDNDAIRTRSLDLIRVASLEILSGNGALAARLGALAAFAEVVGDVHRVKTALELAELVEVMGGFLNADWVSRMHEALLALELPVEVPVRALIHVLAKAVTLPDARVSVLLGDAVEAFLKHDGHAADPHQVAAAFLARRKSVGLLIDERLSEMVLNYAKNHTLSNWYIHAPSLKEWVRGLVLRVALIRFLVYANPEVAALAGEASPERATETVERVTVRVVYRFSRIVEHHKVLLHMLDEVLPQTMPGMEHTLCLLTL